MEQSAPRNQSAVESDAERLRAHGERVEQLLGEIHGSAGPGTWQRVEELMQRLVELYGAGLERVLRHASATAAHPGELQGKLCSDELVSSLLILHGLHPIPTEGRVRSALEEVQPYLRSHSGGVEFLGLSDAGVVKLRLVGTCGGCRSSAATIENLVRRAIEDVAPEVTGIEVESAEEKEAHAAPVVQLGVDPAGRPPPLLWVPVDGVERLPVGGARALQVEGINVLFVRTSHSLVAYRNACGGCHEALDEGTVTGGVLQCPGCKRQFDVGRAGVALEAGSADLVPIPLLSGGAGVRIGLRGAAR